MSRECSPVLGRGGVVGGERREGRGVKCWCGAALGTAVRGGTAVRTEEHEREGKEWSPAPGKGQGEWSELPLE